MYCAVIGDIVKSKGIANRGKAQEELAAILTEINEIYSYDIAADFVITLGDEFQGVLKNPANVLNIIQYINERIYPIEIRYGIGLGSIKTEINRRMSIGADGPAFYSARDAISEMKTGESKYEQFKQLILIKTEDKNDAEINLVNAALSLCSQIESEWTKRQREIIRLMKQQNDVQSSVAQMLGINKSSVHNSLASSKYYSYKNAMKAIAKSINNIWDRQGKR